MIAVSQTTPMLELLGVQIIRFRPVSNFDSSYFLNGLSSDICSFRGPKVLVLGHTNDVCSVLIGELSMMCTYFLSSSVSEGLGGSYSSSSSSFS